jgi:hypothetical protein
VVRIQLEEVGFTLGATRTESATGEFSEIFAQQVARLTVEKDFPEGMEPAHSVEQLEHIPWELENRLPDFCVDGNEAWLVDPQRTQGELLSVPPRALR